MLFAFALFANSLPQQTKPIPEAPQLTIAPIELKPYAQVTFEVIDEMSGIVKSRKLKDTYWVHNDSHHYRIKIPPPNSHLLPRPNRIPSRQTLELRLRIPRRLQKEALLCHQMARLTS